MDYKELQIDGYYRVVEASDYEDFHAIVAIHNVNLGPALGCLLYTSPSPRD